MNEQRGEETKRDEKRKKIIWYRKAERNSDKKSIREERLEWHIVEKRGTQNE